MKNQRSRRLNFGATVSLDFLRDGFMLPSFMSKVTPQLYDTMTKRVLPLIAQDGKSFRFYCCGPTVYGPAHIGNFRTFLVQDIFRRLVEAAQLHPVHVRNLTDVDDKTIKGSQKEGVPLKAFTERWTKKFHEDCALLNMLPPHVEPKATEHIPQMLTMIEQLVANNHAYVAKDGSVYFRVNSFDRYGCCSHIKIDLNRTQSTNSAGEQNDADEYDRESVTDFALWKSRKPEDGENFWKSPWGEGRPGWHIECSAMSTQYLGNSFDLHGGGVDLCFPHHDNEIAQSECAHGNTPEHPYCRHWFHVSHLMVDGAKMSKSLGNLYTLGDLMNKGFTPMEIRYALTSGHYRQQLNFTLEGLAAARSTLRNLKKSLKRLLELSGIETKEFIEPKQWEPLASYGSFEPAWNAIADDMNVSAMLGEVFKALHKIDAAALSKEQARAELSGLSLVLYVLGLFPVAQELESQVSVEVPTDIQILAQQRWDAKAAKNWPEADRLRKELTDKGWKILDSKDGFTVEPL